MNKRELFQNNTGRLGARFLPTTTPILMYGILLFFLGIALYLFRRSARRSTIFAWP